MISTPSTLDSCYILSLPELSKRSLRTGITPVLLPFHVQHVLQYLDPCKISIYTNGMNKCTLGTVKYSDTESRLGGIQEWRELRPSKYLFPLEVLDFGKLSSKKQLE